MDYFCMSFLEEELVELEEELHDTDSEGDSKGEEMYRKLHLAA